MRLASSSAGRFERLRMSCFKAYRLTLSYVEHGASDLLWQSKNDLHDRQVNPHEHRGAHHQRRQ
jgi:hypothetical protein